MSVLILFCLGTLLAQTSFSVQPMTSAVPNPADVWVMNEGVGNTFSDAFNTNSINAGGMLTWGGGPGALANAAHFSGTFDSFATNHANFNPNTNQPFTFSTWVSFDSVSSALEIIASQLNASSLQGWYIYKNSTLTPRQFVFRLQDATGKAASVGFYAAAPANYVQHLVVTVDGSGKASGVALTVNGELANTPVIIQDDLAGDITPNAAICLGCLLPGPDARHVGYQASTRVYNRVLTQAEILTLYEAGPLVDAYLSASRSTSTVAASNFSAQDADCTTGTKVGGGTATDDTAKLNAVLLTASSSNPLTLDLSGGCSLVTGLFVLQSGYTTIQGNGWNSGLFVKSGSNSSAISNGWWIYPSVTPGAAIPARGRNVTLRNLRINGNRKAFPNGNSTIGDARGLTGDFIPGVDLSNIDGLILDTVWIYDAPSFAFVGSNLTNVSVVNSKTESPSSGVNTDGLHFDGPSSNITLANDIFIGNGDDAIALNGPEGYGGTISNVTITNPNNQSLHGFRAYGTVTEVTINNCSIDTSQTGNSELQSLLMSGSQVNAFACALPSMGGSGARGRHGFRGATARH